MRDDQGAAGLRRSGRRADRPRGHPASGGTGRSRGPLFVNYGGPGANAVGITKQIGTSLFAPYVENFDLIGLDPRGTGDSEPSLDCDVNQATEGIYRRPFARPEPVAPERQIAIAKKYADRCVRRNARIAPHVSTANVARDMDLVRRALGAPKITYFGFSYGTMLGATYAAMFGEHLRAAVLDGALNPDAYLSDPVRGLSNQTSAFETGLARYLGACKAAKGFCKWTRGADPLKAYDQLVARADRKPIPARNRKLVNGHTEPVSGDDLNFAVAGELYAKQLWPELTQALNQARKGDASLMRLLVDAERRTPPQGPVRPGHGPLLHDRRRRAALRHRPAGHHRPRARDGQRVPALLLQQRLRAGALHAVHRA